MDGPRILEVVHIVARATWNTRERSPKNRSFSDNFPHICVLFDNQACQETETGVNLLGNVRSI